MLPFRLELFAPINLDLNFSNRKAIANRSIGFDQYFKNVNGKINGICMWDSIYKESTGKLEYPPSEKATLNPRNENCGLKVNQS